MIGGRMEGDVEVELTFDSTNSNVHEEGTMKAFTSLQGRARECEKQRREANKWKERERSGEIKGSCRFSVNLVS